MKTPHRPDCRWSTASFGAATETTPMELLALGAHLQMCRGTGQRMFRVRRGADAVQGFVMSRLVTSAAGLALLLSVGWMVV